MGPERGRAGARFGRFENAAPPRRSKNNKKSSTTTPNTAPTTPTALVRPARVVVLHAVRVEGRDLPVVAEDRQLVIEAREAELRRTLSRADFAAAQQFLLNRGIRVPEEVSLVCTDADPGGLPECRSGSTSQSQANTKFLIPNSV